MRSGATCPGLCKYSFPYLSNVEQDIEVMAGCKKTTDTSVPWVSSLTLAWSTYSNFEQIALLTCKRVWSELIFEMTSLFWISLLFSVVSQGENPALKFFSTLKMTDIWFQSCFSRHSSSPLLIRRRLVNPISSWEQLETSLSTRNSRSWHSTVTSGTASPTLKSGRRPSPFSSPPTCSMATLRESSPQLGQVFSM